MLNLASKHAIKALALLASYPADSFCSITQLAKESSVPGAYLSKIFNEFVKNNIIEAKRGAQGGVRLKKRDLTLFDVCVILQDPILTEQCLLSNKRCSGRSPCTLHEKWKKEQERIHSFLRESKISDIKI
ncbi:MAG: Rrf2 family transcriptional regulator [Bdellovibrionales bacterium]|nr:Rrf2 family transcriptional regulator [Bdellovibrionales bacterium]